MREPDQPGPARVTRRLPWIPALAAGALSACVFETRPPSDPGFGVFVHPDLDAAPRMYVVRQFLRPASAPAGDTILSFIRYSFPKDTGIAGVTYRLMREEELAYRNFDQGLRIYASAFAARVSGESLFVNQLTPVGTASGRLAFKTGLDTSIFADERVPLIENLFPGTKWMSRKPSPSGHGMEFKTYVGNRRIDWSRADSADAISVTVPEQANLRTYEWYRDGFKVFSSTSYAYSADGADSARVEEEFLEERGFTAADTEAVLRSSTASP